MSADVTVTIDAPNALSKLKKLQFLAKDVVFYGVATVITRSFFLLTFPLLARTLGVAEYGIVDLVTVVITFLSTIVILGQDSAVARYFYDVNNTAERREVISRSLFIQLGAAIVVTVALLAAMPFDPLGRFTQENSKILFQLVLLHLPFVVLTNFSLGVLKWTFSRRAFAIVALGQAAVNAALLVFAILWLDFSILHVFAISLATRFVFGLLGLWLCRPWLVLPRGRAYWGQLVLFAAPYGIIGAIGTFVPLFERSAVTTALGSTALGLYAAGALVGTVVMLPIQAFQTAWGPFAYAIHKDPDAAVSYDHILKAFALIACVGLLALVIVAPAAVTLLAGSAFAAGAIVVLPIGLGLTIQGISWITEIGIGLSKRTHLQLYGYFGFLLVGGLGVVAIGRPLGIFGVACGVLLGHMAKAIINTALAARAYPIRWSYLPVAEVVLVTAVVGAAHSFLTLRYGTATGAVVGLVGVGSLVAVGWSRLFSGQERSRILQYARMIRSKVR